MANGTPRPERATNASLGALLVSFVNAVIGLVVLFGAHVNAAQEAQIGLVVNSFVTLAVALSHVYSQITAERERWSHLDGPSG